MLARRAIATGIFGQIPLNRQIANLFRSGEQGAWYDPSDWSTLFQDSAGTTPVTAAGQPVGKMLDKSGRGNHASRPTAINRPVLQQDASGRYYLAFNGTNSWMSTAAIDFTSTDKMTVCLGVKKAIDHTGVIAELSAITDDANPGSFIAHAATNNSYIVACRGSATNIRNYTGQSSGISHVMHTAIDFSVAGEGEVITRINALPVFGGTSDGGSSTFGNYPIYIGSRGGSSLFLDGDIYGLIIRGAASTDTQISAAEKFLNRKTGAY